MKPKKILVEISARHIHLTQQHIEKLFGKSYKLTPMKKLFEPGLFSGKETLTLINGKNKKNGPHPYVSHGETKR